MGKKSKRNNCCYDCNNVVPKFEKISCTLAKKCLNHTKLNGFSLISLCLCSRYKKKLYLKIVRDVLIEKKKDNQLKML